MKYDYLKKFILVSACILQVLSVKAAPLMRIKELVNIEGARSNQLFGYGLVVGLNGTGDKTQTVFTAQSLNNMLVKMGVSPAKISKFGLQTSGSEMKVKNVAAVMVTAELEPFARPGTRIDVKVSSIGDSKSLEGGTLIVTPLQGADNKIYAVAQGAVSVGGREEMSTIPPHPTVGHIPNGAYVENHVPVTMIQEGSLTLGLKKSDFTTATRIEKEINKQFSGQARALDGGTIKVHIPENYMNNPIEFISKIEQLKVRGDASAKVIINERTGTIVAGENVKISSAAVSHGTLTVNIGEAIPGQDQKQSQVMLINEAVSIGDVAKTLSMLGARPSDMIAIFQAMRQSGALKADLEMM